MFFDSYQMREQPFGVTPDPARLEQFGSEETARYIAHCLPFLSANVGETPAVTPLQSSLPINDAETIKVVVQSGETAATFQASRSSGCRWGKRHGWEELRSERSQMSKNFELLQRLAKEELLTPAGMPEPLQQAVPSPTFTRQLTNNEEITKLVQRLFLHGGQAGGPRVVSFSGIAHDDRSSWICAWAGESLASQADTSVCVVDANFWSPQLHICFGVGNRTGLVDALTTEGSIRSFATPLSSGNLWLMPSGSEKGDLYTHVERCRVRLAELREEFNYILISAPPLTRETEATLMGHLTDGIVLIVEANQTRRESVRQAKERLETAQVQLLGAVLDQRTFPIPEFLYRKF